MKKHLIAAAVAGAFAMPAMAQVTVYGVFDIGYAIHDEDANGRETSGLKGGNTAGNRIGFRGEEDLGGGMKAGFVIETGWDPTGDNGLFAARDGAGGHPAVTYTSSTNRQSFASLSGGFGTVRVGYMYSPDYTLVGLSGIHSNTEGWGGGVRNTTIIASRAGGFQYSNTIGGVGFTVHYGTKTDIPAANGYPRTDSNALVAAASYSAGPLLIGAAIGQSETARSAASDANTPDTDAMSLAARYDLGVARVGFTYGTKDVTSNANAETDTTHYELSVAVPVGAMTLIASLGNEEVKSGATKAVTTDRDSWEVGATYALSKRTTMYAFIGERDNKKAAAGAADKVNSKTVIGLRHSF